MAVLTPDTVLDEYVRNGSVVLDERVGGGWRGRVDLDGLDMGDPCRCVLGQLCGDFYDGVRLLGIGFGHADRLGFETSDGDYDALSEAWRRALL